MNSVTFKTIFVLGVVLLGCARHRRSEPTPLPPPPPSAPAKPSSCDILKSSLNEGTTQWTHEKQSFSIERHYQRVVRKNCSGAVVSDKVETVKSPTYEFPLIAPQTDKKFQSVFVFNESTCDHRLTTMPITNFPLLGSFYNVTGDGQRRIEIKGDLSQALLTFRLNKGFNRIYVQYFYDCSPQSVDGNSHAIIGTATCKSSRDFMMTDYPLWINYEERTLDGFKEVIPTEDECKKLNENQK